MKRDWNIFFASVFFVLGFSSVFALLGVLLQTALSSVGYTVSEWLGRIGGVIIIFFGLFLVGLVQPKFLQQEHKITVKHKFKSMHVTSFVFGAAFAVGWTPCVTAALGAILGLAASNPGSAFFLLFAYTLGIGLPFLAVGLFSTQAQSLIAKSSKWLKPLNIIFGVFLIILGVLVFTGHLAQVANHPAIVGVLSFESMSLGEDIEGISIINLAIAALAGFISFLSPCVLPLVPAFLTYLASVAIKK